MPTGQLTPTSKLWRAITLDIDDEKLTSILNRSPSDVERTVLNMRFGLTGKSTTTLAETGEQMNLNADDIRKTEALALRKLRTAMAGQDDWRSRFGAGAASRAARLPTLNMI